LPADEHRLRMDQLRVGHYVYLDLKWTEHPFAFSKFKIKTEQQIATLRSLGLTSVRYSPEGSDCPAPPVVAEEAPTPPAEAVLGDPAVIAKRQLIEQMQQRRVDIQRVEASFMQTARAIKEIEKNLYSRPAETVKTAEKLVSQITDAILSAPELAIHVMSDKEGSEDLYVRSLNVTMLSVMMARDLKLSAPQLEALGMGALMHDIGLTEVPDKILLKTSPLSSAEQRFYELHCHYGVAIGQKLHLSESTLAVIKEHHELVDGSGFPDKLKGDAISLPSRIVSIATHYDQLCNPTVIDQAMTPFEALSMMFAKQRSKFDAALLPIFIRNLGVYPPGTIVQLNNGAVGMVTTINAGNPLKPALVIYDPDIPKSEAMMFDMADQSEISIVKALRPADVSREVYAYLSPRKQVSYYFEAKGNGAGGQRG